LEAHWKYWVIVYRAIYDGGVQRGDLEEP
jgi:hypothetical protein